MHYGDRNRLPNHATDPAEQARYTEARLGAARMRHVAFTRWEWSKSQQLAVIERMLLSFSVEEAVKLTGDPLTTRREIETLNDETKVWLPGRRRWWHRFFR